MVRTHRFKVAVNCADFSCECADFVQDGMQIHEDCGMIALPETYSETGEATRMVISCHGAGGTVETDDSQIEQQTFTKYLLANGYAVMDVNGLPHTYAERAGIDIRNNVGSPIAMQCYIKAYHYCTERFNLKREVFVHGGSMGGISGTNLVLTGCIPVIAHSAFCPVLDTYNQIFLHPWTGGLPKIALGKFYGFDKSDAGEYIYDEEKVAGFNPVGRCIGCGAKEYLHYPVPVKFWQCEDDGIVCIDSTKRFVRAIKNAGGIAYLRTFPTGGHEPQDAGEWVERPSGKHIFGEEILKIKPAVEEAFLWIRRFD